jgi:hypothetical protein
VERARAGGARLLQADFAEIRLLAGKAISREWR